MTSNSTFHSSNTSNILCQVEEAAWSRGLKTFAVFFVGGCGIFGNMFIIVLAVKYTVRRNLHHMIINMAVADILVVLSVFCIEVPQILDSSMWADIKMVSGNILCKLFTFLVGTSMSVSYTSLLIICIERFRASRQTARISQPYSLKQRLAIVACSWLITFAFAALALPYRIVKERLPGIYVCQGTSQVPIVLRIVYFTIFLSAACCIVTLSVVTLRRISRRQEIESSLSELQRKAREKRIATTMKMVLWSLFAYFATYLPFVIWNILKIILKHPYSFLCLEHIIFDFLTNLLPLVNSCFSPGIYLIFLTDFREAAKKALRRNERIAEGSTVQSSPKRQDSSFSMGNIQSRRNLRDNTDC